MCAGLYYAIKDLEPKIKIVPASNSYTESLFVPACGRQNRTSAILSVG